MTKTTNTKGKETMTDDKMKRENKAFNDKLEKHRELFEELEKTFKLASDTIKETENQIFEVKLDDFTTQLQDLKEWNQENYKEMMKLVKKIRLYNAKILEMLLNPNDFKQFKKEGKISVELQGELKEEQKKIVEALNNKFITEKTLLIFPFWIEGGINKDEVQLFQEDFETLSEEVKKRDELLEKYYQFNSRIILTNQQIGKMQNLFFDILPRFQDETKETINLTEKEVFDLFSDIQGKINDSLIDEKELFKITMEIESDYKISFNYDEELKKTNFTFEREINTTGHKIDLSNPRIQELEKENKELKEQLEKKEDIQEEIEILSDFKPIPIDNQYSFNDKISKSIVKLSNNKIAEITKQGTSKRNKNEVMKVLIANSQLQTNEQVIDDFEELTFETIYSLIKKNKRFDSQMIKDQLTQQKGNRHKSEIDDLIDKAIQKGRTTMFQIEIPEKLKDTIKGDFDRMGIKEPFLPLREYYVIKGGQKKSVFELTSKSIYFDYVEAKNQLITKENKMLQFKGFQKNKTNLLLIKRISDRVQDMKYQQKKRKGHSYIDTIKIESLFERIDFNEESIQEKSVQTNQKRKIDIVEKILNQYKKEKIIKSFKIQEDIKIELFPYKED